MLRAFHTFIVAIATTLALAAPAGLFAQDIAAADHKGAAEEADARPVVALMGTIPIYWGEAAGFDELLSGETPAHWAREVLERSVKLAPLDYLSQSSLAQYHYLLLAQPRGLSAEENVALDSWVRDGGKLVLFTDPMMTGESRFHVGDRRRPQDVALLSPILGHWGLELRYDTAQQDGLHMRQVADQPYPVNQAGELAEAEGGNSTCSLENEGLFARCNIEDGSALIAADAALLDLEGPHIGGETSLMRIIAQGLGILREDSGPEDEFQP